MAQILVRDLDEEVVRSLKELARLNDRSLEGEVRRILKDAVSRKAGGRQAVAEIERLHAAFAGRPMADSLQLLHEGRAELEAKWNRS
jgi:plasmid stability protein